MPISPRKKTDARLETEAGGGRDPDGYSPAESDALALAACETVVARPGMVCDYDVEAYRRVGRKTVAFGEHQSYDPGGRPATTETGPLQNAPTDGRPYFLRIGGFRRDHVFGAEEVATALAQSGIGYADSLGNGLFEHLVQCRRHGVRPLFEAPSMGISLPFLSDELEAFRQSYRDQIQEWKTWIGRAEAVYGSPILDRPGQPWLLYVAQSPLALFLASARRRPKNTADELRAAGGASRLQPNPITSLDRAAQLRAWAFIRRRHMEVRRIMAEEVRRVIAADALLVDNAHTLPVVDYELLGEIYDHPGVAMRPGYLDDPALRESYVGYSVRLFADLAGKSPVVSVRLNTLCAGTRFIPRRNAVFQWCDEAVRHGPAGFYFWPVDYPGDEGQYGGVMAGNPDPSAHGRERWDAMLDVFRDLAGANRFCPPPAQIRILVPDAALDAAGWAKVMHLFVRLECRQVWSNLLSTRKLEEQLGPNGGCRVLIAPAMPFASDEMVKSLIEFVRRGGRLLITDPEFASYDLAGGPREPFPGRPPASAMPPAAGPFPLGAGTVHWCTADAVDQHADDTAQGWIYQVRADTVANLTGRAEVTQALAQPDVELRHYLYEHSSSWIMPALKRWDDFTLPGERKGRGAC